MSEVLNSRDQTNALARLRKWQSAIECAVNEVVATHHHSFSRSIQNYADVVHLFEDSQRNISSLRAKFNAARARLRVGDDEVKTAWRQSVVLQGLTRRIDEIERLTHTPEKVRTLLSNGQYLPAAELTVKACSQLTRPEYDTVNFALKNLRRECSACREIVRNQVHTELVRRIFCRSLKCRRKSATQSMNSSCDSNLPDSDGVINGSDNEGVAFTSGDEQDDEFFIERHHDIQEYHRENFARGMDYFITCLIRLGDVSRMCSALEQTAHAEICELVLDALIHCRARKDVLMITALAGKASTNKGTTSHGDETFPVEELVIDHIFCLFRLVLLNIWQIESRVAKFWEGNSDACRHEHRIMTCAVEAMEKCFMRAVSGFLVQVDSGRDGISPLSDVNPGEFRVSSETPQVLELPTFMFQGERESNVEIGKRNDQLDDFQMKMKSGSDAIFVAARHLQSALGVSTTTDLGNFDAQLVRELLAEITPAAC